MNIEKLASKFLALAAAKDESSKSLPRLPESEPNIPKFKSDIPTMPSPQDKGMTSAELLGVPEKLKQEKLFVEIRDLRELLALLLRNPEAKHYTIHQLKEAVDAAIYG